MKYPCAGSMPRPRRVPDIIDTGDNMLTPKQIARQLVSTYHTTDPQQLMSSLDIAYLEVPLPDTIAGFTCEFDGHTGIVVNSLIDPEDRQTARARELGRVLMRAQEPNPQPVSEDARTLQALWFAAELVALNRSTSKEGPSA